MGPDASLGCLSAAPHLQGRGSPPGCQPHLGSGVYMGEPSWQVVPSLGGGGCQMGPRGNSRRGGSCGSPLCKFGAWLQEWLQCGCEATSASSLRGGPQMDTLSSSVCLLLLHRGHGVQWDWESIMGEEGRSGPPPFLHTPGSRSCHPSQCALGCLPSALLPTLKLEFWLPQCSGLHLPLA